MHTRPSQESIKTLERVLAPQAKMTCSSEPSHHTLPVSNPYSSIGEPPRRDGKNPAFSRESREIVGMLGTMGKFHILSVGPHGVRVRDECPGACGGEDMGRWRICERMDYFGDMDVDYGYEKDEGGCSVCR